MGVLYCTDFGRKAWWNICGFYWCTADALRCWLRRRLGGCCCVTRRTAHMLRHQGVRGFGTV